jgi:hypothetical protein
MSPLVFLGIALGLSFLGVLVLWMRSRPPKSVDAHIRAFSRELEALAPDSPATPGRAPADGPDGAANWPQAITPQPIQPMPSMHPSKPMRPMKPHSTKAQPKRGRRSG